MRRSFMSDVDKLVAFSCDESHSDVRYSFQRWIEQGTGKDLTPDLEYTIRKQYWLIRYLTEKNGHVLAVERETEARNSPIRYVTSVSMVKSSPAVLKVLHRDAANRAESRQRYGMPSIRLMNHVSRLPNKKLRDTFTKWLFPELEMLDVTNKEERKELKKLLP